MDRRLKRATQARLRKRVKFLGIDNGLFPLLVSGGVSLLLAVTRNDASTSTLFLCALPFVLTFGVMALLFNDRRPHFARDVAWCVFPGARVRTAYRPGEYPIHPSLPRSTRGTRYP